MKKYSQITESLPSKTIVFAFMRMNPPTIGHELVVKFIKKVAQANNADYKIFVSPTVDKKKNPLTVDQKLRYLKLMFPGINFIGSDKFKTPNNAFISISKKYGGYNNIIIVCGSDRVQEFNALFNTDYVKQHLYDSVKIISAGDRDPDADDASGMSASKMRAAAAKGDFAIFKKGMPSSIREIDAKNLMNDVRAGLGLEAIREQVVVNTDALREQYFRKEIFLVGDIIESSSTQYKILNRGSNYLTVVDVDGLITKKWLQECTVTDNSTAINFNKVQENMRYKDEIKPISEELTDKTLRTGDKVKIARVIADMLGVENAESMSPEVAINTGLRKIKNKRMTPDLINVIRKMLTLAQEVGVKVDMTLVPKAVSESAELDEAFPVKKKVDMTSSHTRDTIYSLYSHDQIKKLKEKGDSRAKSEYAKRVSSGHIKEDVVDKKSTFNIAKDILRYDDFRKLNNAAKGIVPAPTKPADSNTLVGGENPTEVGHMLDGPADNDHLRRMKVKFKTEDVEQVDELSTDLLGRYKTKAGEYASASDKAAEISHKAGEHEMGKRWTERANKKFSGVIKATKKQFANDVKEGVIQPSGTDKIEVNEDPLNAWKNRMTKAGAAKFVGTKSHSNTSQHLLHAVKIVDGQHVKVGSFNRVTNKGMNEEQEIEEDVQSADYKVNPETGRKSRAHHIDFKNSVTGGSPSRDPEDGEEVKPKKHKPLMKPVGESVELEDEFSEKDLEDMAATVDEPEDILDAYDDEELVIVDGETGEHIANMSESTEALNEVLSRMERMKAKVRFARSASKRERRAKIALKSRSSSTKINQRARHLAVNLLKQRMIKKPLAQMTVVEKERVEAFIAKRKNLINRLAMKLAPRVRKIENERLSHTNVTK